MHSSSHLIRSPTNADFGSTVHSVTRQIPLETLESEYTAVRISYFYCRRKFK